MLAKGDYTVKGLLLVSKSLANQRECQDPSKSDDVSKCLLEKDGVQFVSYFLDDLSFGDNSIITILNEKQFPLLYKIDYKVKESQPYRPNKKLIASLLDKKSKTK